MDKTKIIYEIQASLEVNRPMISLDIAENKKINWREANAIRFENAPAETYKKPIKLTVKEKNPQDWDCYYCSGLLFFSQKAFTLLGDAAWDNYERFQVEINGFPYFFLRCKKKSDALDRKRSKMKHFGEGDDQYFDIERYTFHHDRIDPDKLFSISETNAILCNDKLIDLIMKHLTGILLVELI